jgi:hypothetical protein
MFSLLRKGLVYNNVSPDIVEHDLDIDADQWSYDGRDVYRGSIDPEYLKHNLNVYWLYDDDSKRIGLAEHDPDDVVVFKSLWFYDNPYATLFQDSSWKSTSTTLWSRLSNEAYQDCLDTDFKMVSLQALNSGTLLMTPEMLINKPDLYTCIKCNKKSLMAKDNCPEALVSILEFSQFSILFLDDDFVVYEKSTLPQQQLDASEQEQLELLNESPVLVESLDAETLLAENHQPEENVQEQHPHRPLH